MKLFLGIFTDIYFIIKGYIITVFNIDKYKDKKEYSFAFLVHSRSYKDMSRKFPVAKKIPRFLIEFIMNHLWPITLSKVTGLKSVIYENHFVPGYVLGITMTAEQLMNQRKRSLRKIRWATYLAKGRGVDIIGLGGLTSSLSKGGLDILDIPIHITTGHAYTAYNVTETFFKIFDIFDLPKDKIKIAIVGAAGSVGSISSQIIARKGFKNIKLIDLKRKIENVEKLASEIKDVYGAMNIDITDNISSISDCDFVITATNAPEALVTDKNVRDGMVIIDDAQPSDIHPDVLKMDNVLVLEAGVVHTPNIFSNFNYGLKDRNDNFCCMAELLVLAGHHHNDHYVINKTTLDKVDEISFMGKKLGFRVAEFQNFLESIKVEKIEYVKMLARKKYK